METKERVMLPKAHTLGEESEDSDSPEIFRNQFSDTDDEIDQEHVINIVRKTNITKPNVPAVGSRSDSDKMNIDKAVSSNNSPGKTWSRNLTGTPRAADSHKCAKKTILSSSSTLTDSSHTESEDESATSDDDDPEHWRGSNSSVKYKNKNFIPVGKTPRLNLQTKQANKSGQIEGTPDNSTDHLSEQNHLQSSRSFTDVSHRYKTPNSTFSSNDDHRKEDINTVHPLPTDNSTCMDAQSTTFPPSTHSSFNSPGLYPQAIASSATLSDQGNTFIPNSEHKHRQTNDTAGSSEKLFYVSQTRSGTEFNRFPSQRTQSFPVRMQTTENSSHERRNDHETDFHSYATSNENGASKFQFEDQSGSYDISSWKKNWTTDDYLVCPNFLAGAPSEEEFNVGNKTRHRPDRAARPKAKKSRVPRMFHRRAKKYGERDMLREQRFSEVSAMMNTPLTGLFKMVKDTGIDVTKLLENADKLGFPVALPCMQCFETAGVKEVAREYLSGHGQSPDGRCQRCGGQLQSLASMGKMIAKLRKVIVENKFVIRDVYPDGNCMFGTVIDQLRVRGDFRYTVSTLRAAVVDYLRENPTAEDGTPLEMFLTNETWEDYLIRMSEDGQWGDHMVLNALTNVLQTRIIIYGGRSGETETVLTPKHLDEESQQEAKSDPERTDVRTIHLGHFGETHYVSFRPENWWHHIQERSNQTLLELEQRHLDPSRSMYVPVPHLDLILRYTFQLEHISNYMSHIAELPNDGEGSEFTVTLVGPIMCKMVPDYKSQVESIAPDISIFFPSAHFKVPKSSSVLSVFQTPVDTVIQDDVSERRPLNLLTENSSSDISLLRLLPVTPALWKSQTMSSSTGSICLKAVDIECFPMEGVPISYANEELSIHRTLAFKSQWPEIAKEWISRERRSRRPEEHVVQLVASVGCHVVPITPNENQSNVIDSYVTADMINSQELWSYSFAVAETKLCNYLSYSQRCCFLLFKSLLDFTCSYPPLPASLPKSVFFYACENIEEGAWRLQPGRCLIVMIEKLLEGLRTNFIPHYFMFAQNLLLNVPSEHIAGWANTVEGILKEPLISLYFVLDMLDVTASEIGAVFDDILDDLPKFNYHHSIERSFNEAFIPTSATLIENLVYQREYHFALKSLEDIHEQICQFSGPPVDLAKVITMVLPNLMLGYRWCLGLYVDLMKGTTVTREIGNTHDAVHITELFGPDIDGDEMPNTVVPACYSISTGDLKFPTVCAQVMLNAGKKKLLAKCLRYFIDSYSELAGDNIVLCQRTCQHMQLKLLQGLYITLLETYDDLGIPNEFRPLMPNLATITEWRQDHNSFHDLAWAWETLGEHEKAVHCCPCYHTHGTGGINNVAQQLLGGLEAYGY